MDCLFCNINKETSNEKTRIIHQSRNALVLLSDPRLVPGHLLVIPKRHVEKISELTSDEKKEIFDLLVEFQEKLLKRFSGCDIRQNYRPFQKDGNIKVSHLHFHLQPREFKDELYDKCQKYETEMFKVLPEEEHTLILKWLQ